MVRVLTILALGLSLVGCAATVTSADRQGMTMAAIPDDPYLWLEDIEGEKPLAWARAENKITEDELKSDPRFEVFQSDMLDLVNASDRIPYGSIRRGHVYNFWQDPDHVRGVWRRTTIASYRTTSPKWEVLLDIDKLAEEENENWVYEGVDCLAPDFTRCLVELSRGGSDAAVVREFDLETKQFVEGGFELPEAKSSAVWADIDTLFIGTDFGDGSLTQSGYPRVVKRLKRGESLDQAETLFEGEATDVGDWPASIVTPDERYMMIVRSMTFYESAFYIFDGDNPVKLPLPARADISEYYQGTLFFTVQDDWGPEGSGETYKAGSLLAFPMRDFLDGRTDLKVEPVYVPGPREAVEGVDVSGNKLLLTLSDNVVGKVYLGTLKNGKWQFAPVAVPDNSTVSPVFSSPFVENAFLVYENMTSPDTLLELDSKTGKLSPLKSAPPRFDAKGIEVKHLEAVSADGTKIPYFIMAPENRNNLPVPTILYGYGGFGVSLSPTYSSAMGKLWATNGGAYVIANIRGGGEFGPAWHEAARRANRQKSFDDFIAVAEDLEKRGYTTPDKLGIIGGSNGGLLTGAVFVQRPDLFGAVISQVPLLDMMRYHLLLAGPSWVDEYGDPDDPDERKALLAYSPYQNVKADVDYPRVLFITSTKDDRVHPGHARKMVARMKEQGHDVLYFETIEGGHNTAANRVQLAEQSAMEFTFFARQLGLGIKKR